MTDDEIEQMYARTRRLKPPKNHFNFSIEEGRRPDDSNADAWHLFLCKYLDNRATHPNGLTFVAVQIAEAIDAAFCRGKNEGKT